MLLKNIKSLALIEEKIARTKDGLDKKEVDELRPADISFNHFSVYAYKGSDLFAVWNILVLARDLNRIGQS